MARTNTGKSLRFGLLCVLGIGAALPAQAVPVTSGNFGWEWDFGWAVSTGTFAPGEYNPGDGRSTEVDERRYSFAVSNENGRSYADMRASMSVREILGDDYYSLIGTATNEIMLGVDAGLIDGLAYGRSRVRFVGYGFNVLDPVIYSGSGSLVSISSGTSEEFQSGSLLLPGLYSNLLRVGNGVDGYAYAGEELYSRRVQTFSFAFRRAEVPTPGIALLLAGGLPLLWLARRRVSITASR